MQIKTARLVRMTITICALGASMQVGLAQSSVTGASKNDWPVYLGDSGRQHYSSLTQINRGNVGKLKQAWSYNSGETRGTGSTMYTSPLVINGVLYGLSPKLVAFALDATTGRERWRTDLKLAGAAQRGLMWWQKGDQSRVYFTSGKELFALNAVDGKPVPGFGKEGLVDMSPSGGKKSYLATTVPGVVFEDVIILGFSTTEDADAYPGSIRAFSAVDGHLVWQFNSIPRPGEPGSETWAEGSLARAGGANSWTGMALDEKRGLLFAPTGSATPDFYGANRLGDNLYANSLLAIDARTGKLKWHYQVVRHDLWDRDLPSPPTLVRFKRDGKMIDGVAVTTKSGHLYVFDRDSGQSIYPLIEQDTLPSTLPGESPAPKQRVSSVTISRQKFEITNRTPEARRFVEEQIKDWDLRPWAPPKVGTVLIYPWYDGGGEWGGSAFDPSNNRLIVNSLDLAGVLKLTEVPAGSSNYGTYARRCSACHSLDLKGTDQAPSLEGAVGRLGIAAIVKVVTEGRGRMPSFAQMDDVERRQIIGYLNSPVQDAPKKDVSYVLGGYVYLKDNEGLPGNTPPWGTLNSIDLATGKTVWKIPFGNFTSHPNLGYGSTNYGGPVVTATGLIFIAATPERKLRAFDTRTGKVLWEGDLPAAGYATPAVYSVNGKQFVVIAAGGGRTDTGKPVGSDYVAFSLP